MLEADTLAIGIDLGATKIAAALVSSDGQVLIARRTPTSAEQGLSAVMDRIAGLARELEAMAPKPVFGIGVGTPGVVDPEKGSVRDAVNLGWTEVCMVEELHKRLPAELSISIGKDTNASALGEYYFGAAQDICDFVYLGVGSGLGGGVMAKGVLVTGADGNAAELGHLVLNPDGWECACGLRGCAETIVSGPGLVRVANAYRQSGRFATSLPYRGELSTSAILTAAKKGDDLALAALDEVGHNLGMVMAACVSVTNPAIFVVGGGLGLAAFDWLARAAPLELVRRTVPASRQNLQIVPSRLSSPAVGAASLVWYYRRVS
jgi:glucokinase